jgi:hypothetical protein
MPKFTEYRPDYSLLDLPEEEKEKLPFGIKNSLYYWGLTRNMENAFHYRNEDNVDWYAWSEGRKGLTGIIVAHDDDGVIIQYNRDITRIVPHNLHVAFVAEKKFPPEFFEGDRWHFSKRWKLVDGNIVPNTAHLQMLDTVEHETRLSKVSSRITSLKEAADDGDITDAEKEELEKLVQLRIKLRRLDLTNFDGNWPELQ